jgi:hypothetical protein
VKHETHAFDLCVVGGGMSGLCAALAAARRGARTALVHDRPVLGGNASSEIRMHICGADVHNRRPNLRETGILEEIRLEHLRHNRQQSYSVWDAILYDKAAREPNLALFLNATCLAARREGPRVASVDAWQLTTETRHTVQARLFADCSGDGILAPLTGADHRIGREARAEYGESIAPERADARTMGLTCLFEARDTGAPAPFDPPPWAHRYDRCEDLPYGADGHAWFGSGYWWVELGGEYDSIHDTERLRHELLRIVFGVWDHIKNRGDHGAANWALDWIGFLPGKRESRRYLGDHVLTQGDVEAGGRFPDLVAYGGWHMDDHHPAGFGAARLGAPATVFHPAPSPYGIPYRALYSRNVENLFCGGRCLSASHAAMSSTRVMGTCAAIGEAIGAAAALAVRHGLDPRGAGGRIAELQQDLIAHDVFLPGLPQRFPEATVAATLTASHGDPAPLRDGFSRPIGSALHAWEGPVGASVTCAWPSPRPLRACALVFDSSLDENIAFSHMGAHARLTDVPRRMVRAFRIETRRGGRWTPAAAVDGHYQRFVRVPLDAVADGVRATFDATWGADAVRLFALWIE